MKPSSGKWEFIITAICVYSVIAYKFPWLVQYGFLYALVITGIVAGLIVVAGFWLAAALKRTWVSYAVIVAAILILSRW